MLLQVLLKDLIAKLDGWRPNADVARLHEHLNGIGGRQDVVCKGCKFGHPKEVTSGLCSELTHLSQGLYYYIEGSGGMPPWLDSHCLAWPRN